MKLSAYIKENKKAHCVGAKCSRIMCLFACNKYLNKEYAIKIWYVRKIYCILKGSLVVPLPVIAMADFRLITGRTPHALLKRLTRLR